MQSPTEEANTDSPQWTLIRDLGVLQVKLIVDGFRDLVLLPTAIIAAAFSLIRSEKGNPGPEFYQLLAAGKRTEHFINLFGALRNAPAGMQVDNNGSGGAEMDDIVSRVETFVVDEYKRGGVTAQAKSRIDEALDRLRRKNKDL